MSIDVDAIPDSTQTQDISMGEASNAEAEIEPSTSTSAILSNLSPNLIDNSSATPASFVQPSTISVRKLEEERQTALAALDSFIADVSALPDPETAEGENAEEEEDEDDEDDEDFEEGQSDQEDENRSTKKQKKSQDKGKGKAMQKKSTSKQKSNDEDEDQVLIMSNERFSVPEVLFAPNQIGELIVCVLINLDLFFRCSWSHCAFHSSFLPFDFCRSTSISSS